jgi:hypothetical protein
MLLAFLFIAFSSNSQGNADFMGISWGSSKEIVSSKLNKKGFKMKMPFNEALNITRGNLQEKLVNFT